VKALTLRQGSPQHRLYQSVGWGIFLLIVAVLPYVLPLYQVSRMNRAITYAVAILGVNLVIGYSGLIALGHSAFFGIGAFLTATLVQDENWDFWMTIPVVFAFTFFVGMVLGLPALRIRGLYLALVTIAFAAVFPTLAKIDALEIRGLTIEGRTGGANGKRIDEEVVAPSWLPSSIFGDANEGEIYRYWLIALIAAVLFLLTRNVLKSRPGRSIIAIRDNEIGAAVSGVNLPITKTLTFGLSSALAGLGGMMLAMDKSFAAEQDFSFTLAVALLVGLVVGGLGTLWGPVAGALVVVFVDQWAKENTDRFDFLNLPNEGPLAIAIFGAILIVVTFFAPAGIVGALRRLKNRFVSIIPRPPSQPRAATAEPVQETKQPEIVGATRAMT
jgi:branched-chain amino acid transport system permease protein